MYCWSGMIYFTTNNPQPAVAGFNLKSDQQKSLQAAVKLKRSGTEWIIKPDSASYEGQTL